MLDKYSSAYFDYITYDKELAPRTIKCRRGILKAFRRRLGDRELNHENTLEALRQFKRDDLSPAYRKSVITLLRDFGDFLVKQGVIEENFAMKIPFPRSPGRHLPRVLSINEIEKIIGYQRNTPVYKITDAMWGLFFEFLATTGCRVDEALSLKVGEIDFENGSYIIAHSKTGEQRYLPIPPQLDARLEGLAATRGPNQTIFFNPRKPDKKLDYSSADKTLKVRCKKTGITKRVSCHMFRHSFCTELLKRDVAISKVQRLLGHRQINTTQIYTHLVIEDLKGAIAKHPLVKKRRDPKDVLEQIRKEIETFELGKDRRFKFHLKETEDSLEFKVTSYPPKTAFPPE